MYICIYIYVICIYIYTYMHTYIHITYIYIISHVYLCLVIQRKSSLRIKMPKFYYVYRNITIARKSTNV